MILIMDRDAAMGTSCVDEAANVVAVGDVTNKTITSRMRPCEDAAVKIREQKIGEMKAGEISRDVIVVYKAGVFHT
jgi:hypothetical protein